MASNPTPDNNDVLRALADRLADGCHTHEVSLNIKQNTEAAIRAAIAALGTAETQLGVKKTAVSDAFDVLQAADEAGRVVINNCKLWLQKKFGNRWSAAWEPTGFPNQSTAIPETQDQRFTLLADLKAYFIEVPANESTEMEATAAISNAAWTVTSDARQALADAEEAKTKAMTARGNAVDALRKRVRGLISELDQLMNDDDARYEAFGLNIPANPTPPGPVPGFTATPIGSGKIEIELQYTTRATRVRMESKIAGVDTEFQNKGSFKDLNFVLKGYTVGQSVDFQAIAGNDGGDAAPGDVVTVVVS